MNYNTKGLSLQERRKIINEMGLIPVGTICFRSGDAFDNTYQVEVTEENQETVSMFWNSLYFNNKDEADIITWNTRTNYNNWQTNIFIS